MDGWMDERDDFLRFGKFIDIRLVCWAAPPLFTNMRSLMVTISGFDLGSTFGEVMSRQDRN
jgi:hypothetical protein